MNKRIEGSRLEVAFGTDRFHLFTSQMRAGSPEIPGVTRGAPHIPPQPPCGCRGTSWPRGQRPLSPRVGPAEATPVTSKARSRPRPCCGDGAPSPLTPVSGVTPRLTLCPGTGKSGWGPACPLLSSAPRATSSWLRLLSAPWGRGPGCLSLGYGVADTLSLPALSGTGAVLGSPLGLRPAEWVAGWGQARHPWGPLWKPHP